MYPNVINLLHIFIVAPLLFLIGLDKIPQEYKIYILYLGIFVLVYHLYKLISRMNLISYNQEAMTSMNDGLHIIKMFDSPPGISKPFIVIKKGDTVRWINTGETQHTITGENGEYHSGYMKPGNIYELTFNEPGEYKYFSIPDYGWFRGKIIVK